MRIHAESSGGERTNQPIKLALSKRVIEGLEPTAGRYYVHDVRQPGLTLAVHPSGEKSFVFLKKFRGRSRRLTLGKFPQLTLENARKLTAGHLASIARDEDPFADRRERRQASTVGELWDQYLREHVEPHCRPTTKINYKFAWKHLEHWRGRKANDLTISEVRAWHVKLGSESPYIANRSLVLLSSIFEYGAKDLPNPCRSVERFREVKRDRYLQPDEMPRFLEALDAEWNETFADCVRLMLFTGCRQSNVCEMRWDQVSFESRSWRIPRTKNNLPLTIPLTSAAMEVLERRKEHADGSPWVLPGKSPSGHITKPKSSWDRFLKRAGIENLRMHDLRRSYGSWMAAGGTSLHIVGKALGHESSKSTEGYAHVTMDPVRTAAEAATQAMLAAARKEGDQ
jgi:integrase